MPFRPKISASIESIPFDVILLVAMDSFLLCFSSRSFVKPKVLQALEKRNQSDDEQKSDEEEGTSGDDETQTGKVKYYVLNSFVLYCIALCSTVPQCTNIHSA